MLGAGLRVKAGNLLEGGVIANLDVDAGLVAQTVAGILSSRLGGVAFDGAPCAHVQGGDDGFG